LFSGFQNVGVMADILSTVSSRSGVAPELAQKGIEALFGSLRDHLPGEAFARVTSSLPGVQQILSSQERVPVRLEDFAGPSVQGRSRRIPHEPSLPLTELLSQLTHAGFTMQSIRTFLPAAVGVLRANLPPELMRHIERSIPGLDNISRPTGPAGLIDRLKNLF
jgi:hypothetical protein